MKKKPEPEPAAAPAPADAPWGLDPWSQTSAEALRMYRKIKNDFEVLISMRGVIAQKKGSQDVSQLEHCLSQSNLRLQEAGMWFERAMGAHDGHG